MRRTLPKTCGNCHAGAGDHFVIGPVHVQTATGAAHPVVRWIRWTYWVLIPLTLGFMILHNLLDFLAKLIRRQPRHESGGQVSRMNLNFRIAHWGVILSFPTLVFTGFALKYPEAWWARPLLLWEGHFAFRGLVHRSAAIVLIAATVYHVIHLAMNRRDRLFLKAMLPDAERCHRPGASVLLQSGAHESRTPLREIQLRRESGILGVHVGHGGDVGLRLFAVVQ